jgi:DnaJ-class molecular chaperone
MHIWRGYWHEVAVCEACDGSGSRDEDVAVVDYAHGGYITTAYANCSACQGNGYRGLTEAEEEQLYAMPSVQ